MSPRLRALVVKRGLGLGLLSSDKRRLVLALAASQFEAGQAYPEQAVNALLTNWLSGGGEMLRTDHVELRRWLVDLGFVERDGFGRAYRRVDAALLPFAADLGAASAEALNTMAACEKAAWRESRVARRREAGSRR